MAITINGSGTIGGVSVGGLPDGIVDTDMLASAAVEQAKIASGVVGTGPAFHAYNNSGDVSISVNSFSKVTLNAESYDTNNCFDTSNYRFTPNVAGYYQFTSRVSVGGSSMSRALATLAKNGTMFIYGNDIPTNVYGTVCDGLIYLNGTTDYVELYIYITATNPQFGGGIGNTFLQGFLARAA